jgi:hypothetical protein
MRNGVPPGLGRHGSALWRRITANYEMRGDEISVLRSACRMEEEIFCLEVALAKAPVTVPGSKGQEKSHPLLAALRAHRLAQARLLRQLGLAELSGDRASSSDYGIARSAAGRRLARQRWNRSG